jgi:hypothetical protein
LPKCRAQPPHYFPSAGGWLLRCLRGRNYSCSRSVRAHSSLWTTDGSKQALARAPVLPHPTGVVLLSILHVSVPPVSIYPTILGLASKVFCSCCCRITQIQHGRAMARREGLETDIYRCSTVRRCTLPIFNSYVLAMRNYS